jgi:hypothetical protein
MPALATRFQAAVTSALGIAEAGEIIRALSARQSRPYRELPLVRLEALHEMAYLRMFLEWENFLEASFLRMMCGYDSPLYSPQFASGKSRQRSLADAQLALYDGRDFILWHNPRYARDRGVKWFNTGPHETVVLSNFTRLEWFAAVRHRIAHGSEDAARKLDAATINLGGRRYRGASAGRFLRDWDTSVSPPQRWVHSIGDELGRLAGQIAP